MIQRCSRQLVVRLILLFFEDGEEKISSWFAFENPFIRILERGSSSDSTHSYLFGRAESAGATIQSKEKLSNLKKTGRSRGENLLKGSIRSENSSCSRRRFLLCQESYHINPSEIFGIFNSNLSPAAHCYVICYPEDEFATVGLT